MEMQEADLQEPEAGTQRENKRVVEGPTPTPSSLLSSRSPLSLSRLSASPTTAALLLVFLFSFPTPSLCRSWAETPERENAVIPGAHCHCYPRSSTRGAHWAKLA